MWKSLLAAARRIAAETRGSAIVETALVFLPVMALMLGIVDFAMPIFLRNTFTHAVRQGARYGITYRVQPGLTHSDSIRRVVQDHAMGFLAGEDGLRKIRVRWFRGAPPFDEVTSGSDRNLGGNVVQVSIEGYTWSWMAPLLRSPAPLTISVASADRLETLRRGAIRPAP